MKFIQTYNDFLNETESNSIINLDLYRKVHEKQPMTVKNSVYESVSVLTVTGLSKENKEELQRLGVVVKAVGPGWYLTVKDIDKKAVLDYLKKENVPIGE